MPIRILLLMSALLGTLLGASAVAEEVRIPVGQQIDSASAKPMHGSTQAQVEEKFGAPLSKNGPVGEPPIAFWDYNEFTVYFESNRVIHSVSKHKSNKAMKK